MQPGKTFSDGVYNSQATASKYTREDITTGDLLEAAVKAAKEVGADGLVNLKYGTKPTDDVNNPLVYTVSGLAIRRK